MHVEEIIEDIWQFGLFQKLMAVIVLGPRGLLGWSMLVMSFTGTIPDWWCVPEPEREFNQSAVFDNTTFQICNKEDNVTCSRVYSNKYNTIVNEWDLVCTSRWIGPSITSIQMGGVLFGALAGGQSAEMFGRRKSHFFFMFAHAIANVIAAFSVSWQMFAVMRFILGINVGALLVVSFTYTMEFIGKKYRSLCSGVPFWSFGVCFFALAAWLTPDWSHLHLICGALHIPFLLGWFFIPESIRWLAVKGRLEEAESVVAKVCRINKRTKPEHTINILKLVADEERKMATDKKYTYIDIFRGWKMCKMSLIIDLQWACLALVYYGILFGVDALSGDLCLNIFLMSVVDIPADFATLYLNNKIGRKYTCLGYLCLGVLGAISAIIATLHGNTRGISRYYSNSAGASCQDRGGFGMDNLPGDDKRELPHRHQESRIWFCWDVFSNWCNHRPFYICPGREQSYHALHSSECYNGCVYTAGCSHERDQRFSPGGHNNQREDNNRTTHDKTCIDNDTLEDIVARNHTTIHV